MVDDTYLDDISNMVGSKHIFFVWKKKTTTIGQLAILQQKVDIHSKVEFITNTNLSTYALDKNLWSKDPRVLI